jgi:hypothetical protein
MGTSTDILTLTYGRLALSLQGWLWSGGKDLALCVVASHVGAGLPAIGCVISRASPLLRNRQLWF